MLLYAMYDWLSKPRHGRLEAQRKRACMVLLTVVSLVFIESGRHVAAVDSWLQLTEASAVQARAAPAMLRPPYAAPP